MHPIFVCLLVFGTTLRVADAAVALEDTTVSIAEGSTGTLATVTASTDAANGVVVTFTAAATSNSLDWIDVTASGSNCVVSLKSGETIDYEDSNLVNNQYIATITALDDGVSGDTFVLTLTITDVVEFTSGLTATIKENLAGGAAVVTVVADGSGRTFAIASQTPDSGWFAIDSTTGAITVVDGQTVDYEDTGLSTKTYSVAVVATASDSSVSSTGTVVITITDTNDFATGLTASAMTGTTTGDITTLTTTPADATVTLVSQTGNLGWFSLTNKVISVASDKTLDATNTALETGSKYLIVLTVGTSTTQGTGTVTVTITTPNGVSAVIGNVMLTLGLLLVSKLVM